MTLVGIFNSILLTLAELAVVVVAATSVRRRHPDAWALIALGAGLHVFATVSFPFFIGVAGRIAVIGSLEAVYSGVQVLMAALRAGGWGLVAWGVARIAAAGPEPRG